MSENITFLRYGDNSCRQQIKKYTNLQEKNLKNISKGLIAIHGGAWRDANNTSADFDKFAEILFDNSDISIIYSIDYKLSSEQGGMFPFIVDDVMKAMDIIKKDSFNGIEFTIVGHSVGCTFITQILEYNNNNNNTNNHLLPNITKVVFLDGIYDVKTMLEEYPEYKFFVIEEFGNLEVAFKGCNAITRGENVPPVYSSLKEIIIVHSLEDELLSLTQPKHMSAWLSKGNVKYKTSYQKYGKHNDVYINTIVCENFLI